MTEYISVENIILPNIAQSNYDLSGAIKQLGIKSFRGVFLRDQLPNKPHKNESGIVNLADSEMPGTHWVCCHKNGNKKYYIVSYAAQPPLEIQNYLGDNIKYNIYKIQSFNTVVCGHICLFVLKKLNDGYDFDDIIFSLMK